jgi:hypothetical protein
MLKKEFQLSPNQKESPLVFLKNQPSKSQLSKLQSLVQQELELKVLMLISLRLLLQTNNGLVELNRLLQIRLLLSPSMVKHQTHQVIHTFLLGILWQASLLKL